MDGGRRQDGHDAITAAWSQLPLRRHAVADIGRGFTSTRMERILQIAVGLACAVLGAQAFGTATSSDLEPPLRTVVTMSVFALLAVMIVLCVVGRGARHAAAAFAVAFPAALLVLWTLPAPAFEPEGGSWVFFLLNAAPAAAALVFPLPWQIAWTAGVPLLFAAMRLTRRGFTAENWLSSIYDVSLALIVGTIVLAIVWMFRSLASGVDEARAAAIAEYSAAAAAEATERERVEVAALMHDSVLAALIAAGRAESPRERQLAVSMAQEALTRLANAESDEPEGSDEPVTSGWVRGEVRAQARALGVELAVDGPDRVMPGIPGRVARALVLAATQAVANAVEHAGGAGLRASIRSSSGRLEIVVADTGGGVDLEAIAPDRLGIRASIVARVAAVGGRARIDSGPSGTVVTLVWPADGDRA